MRTAPEIAKELAEFADEHYRFTSATRKQVAETAVRDLLDEVMPVIPMLVRMVANDERPPKEHNAMCALLDYLGIRVRDRSGTPQGCNQPEEYSGEPDGEERTGTPSPLENTRKDVTPEEGKR